MGGFAAQPRLPPRARGFARAVCQMAPNLRPWAAELPLWADVPAAALVQHAQIWNTRTNLEHSQRIYLTDINEGQSAE